MKYIFDENNRLIGRTDNLNMTGLEIDTEPPSFNPIHQDCKYINNAWFLVDRDRSTDAMKILRRDRNAKLSESDWRMTTDYPYNDQAVWASYRTQLRNLPATANPTLDEQGNLIVDWPTAPDAV